MIYRYTRSHKHLTSIFYLPSLNQPRYSSLAILATIFIICGTSAILTRGHDLPIFGITKNLEREQPGTNPPLILLYDSYSRQLFSSPNVHSLCAPTTVHPEAMLILLHLTSLNGCTYVRTLRPSLCTLVLLFDMKLEN